MSHAPTRGPSRPGRRSSPSGHRARPGESRRRPAPRRKEPVGAFPARFFVSLCSNAGFTVRINAHQIPLFEDGRQPWGECKCIGGTCIYPYPFGLITQRALDQLVATDAPRASSGKTQCLCVGVREAPGTPTVAAERADHRPAEAKTPIPFGAGAVDALPGRSARATRALPGAIAQRPRRGACLPRRGRQLTGGGLLDAGCAGAVVCEGQALGGNT